MLPKSILVASDGSDHALAAVRSASDLATKYHAKLTVVHVLTNGPVPEDLLRMAEVEHLVEPSPAGSGARDTVEMSRSMAAVPRMSQAEVETVNRVRRAIAEQILDQSRQIAKANGISEVTGFIEDGDPVDEILGCAKRVSADLIVVGSRGLGKVKGLLLGSVSHKINQLAKCDCLTIREAA